MVRLPRNEKQTYRLISRPQMWPSGLTLAMTLTLNFQGQIWNWLYLCQKWSDCHETKSEHIIWILGLKCNHQIWPWPWPWPWIFKVKYEICYISTKSGPIATRRKANISIWTLGLKSDNGFAFGHDLDIWIFKVIYDLDHLMTKVRCKDLPDSGWGDFSCRRAVDSSSFFSCDQAALQMVFSVCLSVCPSVHLSVCPSHLFDYVPIIVSSWNFQELLPMTDVRSMQKVKVRGQRSRSQRSRPI